MTTPAHDHPLTLHLLTHVEAHEPRAGDPHYPLFIQAKARMKRQGLWVCAIGDDLCGGQIELHHAHIEYSLINAMDVDKVNRALGLHLDDAAFADWVESPGNLEPLCVNHHRTHYGVHVIPSALWEPLRYLRAGQRAPAEFVAAKDLPP